MNQLSAQARDAWNKTIDENPIVVDINRKAVRQNSVGEDVVNPFSVPVLVKIKMRIAQESKAGDMPRPVGVSESMRMHAISDIDNVILRDDVIETNGKTYRVKMVETVRRFGDIIGYRASLINIDEEKTGT